MSLTASQKKKKEFLLLPVSYLLREHEEELCILGTNSSTSQHFPGRQNRVSFQFSSCVCIYYAYLNLRGVSKIGIIFFIPGYIDGLADAVEQGLVKAVGVSNYSEKRLRETYDQLKKRGIRLASNQVNYSLIYRLPEENGVKSTCDELGITLIAYSRLAQGALTGKYTPSNTPTGPRGSIYTPEFMTKLQPLINRIKEIGEGYGKTPTQVVLNWLVAQENVVPIPGARNAEQAQEFAGAVGWKLSNDEVEELRSMASQVKPVVGFPVEKL
ncbi:PREDICTED: uncharacterized oxidoreductase At1g06690, chloroplastic-like [Erythranthe guttata]|uniref:uncharacterized oxidoreductase At1g06690, chloroplastic-like n=1 Tax=Erythranthe guttata TaxID=4155 RepID=UPI00064D8D60|nr:PREDICTED: uncharacterized oxidoreductase At1g06690, chloroplastic-like [Erythranthe guttata]|eukprot:XP_012829393.1 PREDICTED: uncharacterized oxidoreductase At1g06690, chloroplastic-like [Erythranthe guttata]